MSRGHPISYSAAELAWVKANATLPAPELHAAFCSAFGRHDVSQVNLMSLRKRNGWRTGRSGRIEAGNVPANKGKPMPQHIRAKCAGTMFKKGNRPHTHRGAGHESIDSKDGYTWLIVDETNPYTGAPTRRVLKHKYLWEQLHGPVPEGYCLKCIDGNRQNTNPANWEAIPRATLPFLNGHRGHDYDSAPTEVKPAIMAVAKLKHAIGSAKKGGS